jgi:hypothetical protein
MKRLTRYTIAVALALVGVGCSKPAPQVPVSQSPLPAAGAAARVVDGKDPALYGVWIPETYMYDGTNYAIDDGLMIITPKYLIANAIYDLSPKKKPKPDANANYGTYEITEPGKLVMDQAMQLHWRSESADAKLVEGDGTFFNQDVPETLLYKIEGDTLTIRFQVPGEQGWILKRVPGETCTPPAA